MPMQQDGGLTDEEARRRLKVEGPNELPEEKRSAVLAFVAVLGEPLVLVLFACGGAYLFLGDRHEAIALLLSVVLVSGITFYQGYRTEKTMAALRDLASPRALVIRSGVERRVSGRDVVRGDLLVLREGDRVPADGKVLFSHGLHADESLLTGESVPAFKAVGEEVFSSTVLTSGRGTAEVVRTGSATRVGSIGKSLREIRDRPTRLQTHVARLARRIGVVSLLACSLVVAGYGYFRRDWLNGILVGLTLAVSLMPEELPLILTIFFAVGAWRISRRHVLTRRISAIESLGSIDVLATDKTGTLTLNRMELATFWSFQSGESYDRSRARDVEVQSLHSVAALACPPAYFDPMDRAIAEWAGGGPALPPDLRHVRDYPLSPELLATVQVWEGSPDRRVCAKGAPEHIVSLCALSDEERVRVLEQTAKWAAQGYRVLGLAEGVLPADRTLPDDPRDFSFRMKGLMGFVDPPRPEVFAALRECRAAGIRVAMMTGDHPETAAAIARTVGLAPSPRVVTGGELREISDEELEQRIMEFDVFARISPEQKLRLVRAYQRRGHIVGMTGDGVNDGPSLKAADVGVAMGGRGTDVAREASALVVLDDNFATIVEAIRLGRTLFANIKKAVSYVVAVHIPIAGTAFLQLATGSILLLPIHVVFLELIIDPACSLVFEAEKAEADVMARKPRDPKAPLFTAVEMGMHIFYGLLLLTNVVLVKWFGEHHHLDATKIRTLCFATLVLGNLTLILTELSRKGSLRRLLKPRNPLASALLAGATLLLALAIYAKPAATIFKFSPLTAEECFLVGGSSFLAFLLMNAIKVGARILTEREVRS